MGYKIPAFVADQTIRSSRHDADLALANSDPLLISRGLIEGTTHINKFGASPLVTAGTTGDVWDGAGVYVFPTAATITHLRQATDQVGTDGGATIDIQGLDANWDLVEQTADLDGTDTTTEVALATPLLRVFRMKVHANIVLAANVWAGATGMTAGTAKAIIRDDHNQTMMAIYTVPRNKTAYLVAWYCDNTPTGSRLPDSVKFNLSVADRANGYEFQTKRQRGIALQGPGFDADIKPHLKITEKSDIKINAEVDGGVGDDANPHCGFDIILIDND